MTGWSREVHQAAIDGVPVLWAEASGPLRATLMFRVGRVDERLSWSGITHLVEHLALFHLGPRQTYEFNGAVTSNRTMFYATGEPADIVAFMAHVTASLHRLPFDRLESEKSVLLAEASSRPKSPADLMFNLRFGARGNGLYRYKEFGLYHLTESWVAAWAARGFSRDNAVMWLSGPPPADLHLSLPAGQPMPQAPAVPMELGLPAYATAGVGGAGVSMVAPRSTSLAMATSIASDRLLKRLRYDKGIAYSVGGGYFPMDRQQAHVSLWTDAQPGQAAPVLNDTVQSVYAMSTEGPSAEELAEQAGNFVRSLDRDEAVLAWLDRTAVRILNGEPTQHPDELRAEMEAVTPTMARDAMAQAVRSAIYIGPEDVPAPPAIHAYTVPTPPPVQGETHPHVRSELWKHAPFLSVSNEGVTLEINANDRITVRDEACEALLRYDDGGILLVSADGSSLPINPTEWVGGPMVIQQIVQRLPATLAVPLPGESTGTTIKVPQPKAPTGFAVAGIPIDRWIGLFVFIAVAVALLAFTIFGNRTAIGSTPPLVSLVLWAALGYRILRRL
ncbi:MAG TPA: hypothetical protein VGV88_04735 [Candidatus Dormibacteraeota bacterium]|nr:hypothetical protein [Candidatus Dormibacteraeota bacterium]